MADLIDRAKAIKAIEDMQDCYNGFSGTYDKAQIIGVLEEVPTAEPQWIPCSKRLPEDLEEVNVTWVNHNPEPYYSFVKDVPFTASAICYKGKWFWYSSTCADILAEYGNNHSDEVDSDVEITAWMPLPKPYKGEADG